MVEGQICRRDGEMQATLEFGPVRVSMGITELHHLLGCARDNIRNASGPVQRTLREPIAILQDAVSRAICEAPRSSTPVEDEAANLARWQATGSGGVTDLVAVKRWAAGTDASTPATARGRACG